MVDRAAHECAFEPMCEHVIDEFTGRAGRQFEIDLGIALREIGQHPWQSQTSRRFEGADDQRPLGTSIIGHGAFRVGEQGQEA